MRSILQKLWRSTGGFVVSTELVLVTSILTIGVLAGLTSIRDQIVAEMTDVSVMIRGLNQSYSIGGQVGRNSSTNGSSFIDQPGGGFCDWMNGQNQAAPQTCVLVCNSLQEEQ